MASDYKKHTEKNNVVLTVSILIENNSVYSIIALIRILLFY